MISGAHVVIYTKDAEADRAFFRDVLQFPFVDAGHGWLIFAMPPLEVAFHDAEKQDSEKDASESGASESADKHELFLMCDDIAATLKDLQAKKREGFGSERTAVGKTCPLHAFGRRKDWYLRAETSESVEA
jgi:catechol 2,3-dioxygenase-like lactoylglutathione lyase family enzyme